MRRPLAHVLLLLHALLAIPAHADARAVRVELRSVRGGFLGELDGQMEGRVTYFALGDVARVARATARVSADGRRAALTRAGAVVELERGRPEVWVRGRLVRLAAPPRLEGGTWLVPGEFVVRAVPALLGAGIEVRVVPLAGQRPRVALVSLPPAAGPGATGPGGGVGDARAVPPPRGGPPSLGVRHHSYPDRTRVVVDGAPGTLPPTVEAAAGELVVLLPGLAPPATPLRHAVADGLVAAAVLEARGSTAILRVGLAGRAGPVRAFRLDDPPRIVLDVFRAVAEGQPAAVAAGPGEPAGGRAAASERVVSEAPVDAPRAGASSAAATPQPRAQAEPEPGAPGSPPAPGGPSPPGSHPPVPSGPPPAPAAARPGARAYEGAGGEPSGSTEPGSLRSGEVEVRHRSYPGYTRVVVEASRPFEPRLVESQGALVVPLVGVEARPGPARAVRDGLVSELAVVRSGGHPALRVAFERPPAARKVGRLQDPPRLVLDFYRAPAGREAAPEPLRTIVLDPGHGGVDPGAIGPGGLTEKEVTLDVARRLAALIQEELGLRAVLTRTRDQTVGLRERAAFANRLRADLFVSIHVNAAPGATATGTETYFLSSEATDNAARAAAAFENQLIAFEAGPRTGARDLLRSILWDLAQSEFQQESSRLAEALQDHLDRALRRPSRGVKQAPFYVLGGVAMPAALVEVGFITNPQEEQRLRDDGYRDRIARALAAGLQAYRRHVEQRAGVLVRR